MLKKTIMRDRSWSWTWVEGVWNMWLYMTSVPVWTAEPPLKSDVCTSWKFLYCEKLNESHKLPGWWNFINISLYFSIWMHIGVKESPRPWLQIKTLQTRASVVFAFMFFVNMDMYSLELCECPHIWLGWKSGSSTNRRFDPSLFCVRREVFPDGCAAIVGLTCYRERSAHTCTVWMCVWMGEGQNCTVKYFEWSLIL